MLYWSSAGEKMAQVSFEHNMKNNIHSVSILNNKTYKSSKQTKIVNHY